MLDHVSADSDYQTWRDICWSIASTGWALARDIAHKWSKRGADYDPAVLDDLLARFDPARGITLGSLFHHAQTGGWTQGLLAGQPPLQACQPPLQTSSDLLVTARHLQQLPPATYRVRRLLPAQGVAALYGESAAGKSFLALDLAHAIGTGRPDWFGFKVIKGPVAYIWLEAASGIAKRSRAVEIQTGAPCPDDLRFWQGDFSLLSAESVATVGETVRAKLGAGATVFIDTLNQSAPGADENSSQDMSTIISGAKRLATAIDGLAILVHHPGKDRSRGMRGHSSLFAALDAVIEVSKSDAGRSWQLTKAKDDEAGAFRPFELVPYVVGADDDGDVISCAVRPVLGPLSRSKRMPAGRHQKAALEELRKLLPAPGQLIDYKTALVAIALVLACADAKRNERAKDAVDGLIRGGTVEWTDNGLRLA